MLSASLGCNVHVWEPNPQNVAALQTAVLANQLWDRITVHHNIAGEGTKPLVFSGSRMDGHVAGTYQHNNNELRQAELAAQGRTAEDDAKQGVPVMPLMVDAGIGEATVALIKVDVEGFEPMVFKSARKALSSGRVRTIIFEYNLWRGMSTDEGVALLKELTSYGFVLHATPNKHPETGKECDAVPIVTESDMRTYSEQLRDNKYPCAMWAINILGRLMR